MAENIFRNPFLKNQNWAYFWINNLKFYTVRFYWCQVEGRSKDIETRLKTTCFYLFESFFFLIKRGPELVSLFHFLHDVWRKIFILLYSMNRPNFIVWLPLFLKILSICARLWRCDAKNFETNFVFLNNLFFLKDQKVKTKILMF